MDLLISINDFSSVCRICLITKDDMITFISPMIIYMLEYCTSVQETSNKNLPQQICPDCYDRLKNAFHFKEQYLLSIKILRGIVADSDKWIKDDDNIEIKDEESVEKETKIESETDNSSIEEIFRKIDETTRRRKASGKWMENEEIIVQINDEIDEESKNEFKCETEEKNTEFKNPITIDEEIAKEYPVIIESNSNELIKSDNDTEQSSNDSSTEEIFRNIDETIKRKRKGKSAELEYPCDICGKIVKRRNYIKHRQCHSNVRPYQCDICDLKFKRKIALIKHKEVVHENKKNTRKELCFICGKFISQTLINHLALHKQQSEIERFQCEKCNRVYAWKNSLRMHIEEKHSENVPKKIPCKICNKIFVSKASWRSHMRFLHSDQTKTRYTCTLCDKSYNRKPSLNEHIRAVHLNSRPHTCSICDKTFHTKSILKNHMRTHTGERPFTCTICGKSFSFSASLRTHMKVHSK